MIITAVFIILVSGLFNENSKYCIVTQPAIKQVTADDFKKANKIIKLYELQQKAGHRVLPKNKIN